VKDGVITEPGAPPATAAVAAGTEGDG